MSSGDEYFNLDKLEEKDAKKEYDSDPSDTGSDSGPAEEEGSDSEAEAKKFLALQEENPGFGVTEKLKKAGEMWAKINSNTKEHFWSLG